MWRKRKVNWLVALEKALFQFNFKWWNWQVLYIIINSIPYLGALKSDDTFFRPWLFSYILRTQKIYFNEQGPKSASFPFWSLASVVPVGLASPEFNFLVRFATNGQLVFLLAVGISTLVCSFQEEMSCPLISSLFIYIVFVTSSVSIVPEKPHWGSSQSIYWYQYLVSPN